MGEIYRINPKILGYPLTTSLFRMNKENERITPNIQGQKMYDDDSQGFLSWATFSSKIHRGRKRDIDPTKRIFLDHLDRKMSHVAWSWRGVICGEMVGIERQLDTITFISPRVVVAQPGRPPDGCNGPHKNKSCYMLPWWPASPIAFQRLSSPDASILKILYDVQWRELKGTTTYISIVINFFIQ